MEGRGMSQGTKKEPNKGTSKETDKELLYSVEDSIATITLNRPERMNALTPALEAELHRTFDQADADRAVRVIILTGAGRAFCAGYDQGQTGKSGTRHSDPKGKSHADFIEFWQRNDAGRVGQWTHMWRLGKPIIAAVNGWAMGGGFCDARAPGSGARDGFCGACAAGAFAALPIPWRGGRVVIGPAA